MNNFRPEKENESLIDWHNRGLSKQMQMNSKKKRMFVRGLKENQKTSR
ncbi:MAG TPA: hypothetical protein QF753_13340 [Victivallales bacterium]|nr:hypothetical protein [Victivallales bacterium]